MKVDQDPGNYNEAVASLKLEYQNPLSEENTITALLYVTGENYATTLFRDQKLTEVRERGYVEGTGRSNVQNVANVT